MTATGAPGVRNNSASLRRALGMLLHLGEEGADPRGDSLSELAAALAMNKSTLLRLLTPLCEVHLIEQDNTTGRYRLGWRTAQLGHAYLERLDLRGAAHGVLQRLMRETSETVHLVVADFPDVVYLDKVDSPKPVRMYSRIGSRQPAYCTAVGKALLAHADELSIRQVIDAGLAPRTPSTCTTEDALRVELGRVRERGYAVDDVENEPEIRCVAAPVFDHSGAGACAVSVSAPAARLGRARVPELGRLVTTAAAEISRRLGARQ